MKKTELTPELTRRIKTLSLYNNLSIRKIESLLKSEGLNVKRGMIHGVLSEPGNNAPQKEPEQSIELSDMKRMISNVFSGWYWSVEDVGQIFGRKDLRPIKKLITQLETLGELKKIHKGVMTKNKERLVVKDVEYLYAFKDHHEAIRETKIVAEGSAYEAEDEIF